jgi:hypothetical protein
MWVKVSDVGVWDDINDTDIGMTQRGACKCLILRNSEKYRAAALDYKVSEVHN